MQKCKSLTQCRSNRLPTEWKQHRTININRRRLSVRVFRDSGMYREQPSPLCFPLLVDSLNRDRISNESMADRVRRMLEAQMGD